MSKFLIAVFAVAAITLVSASVSIISQRGRAQNRDGAATELFPSIVARHVLYFILTMPWLALLFANPKHALFYWVGLILVEYFIAVYWFKTRARR